MRFALSSIGILLAAAAVLSADSVTTFSSGFVVPESIALVPGSFNLAAGSLFVVDFGAGTIDSVSSTGGSPTVLATVPGAGSAPAQLVNGIFDPNRNFIADGYTYSSSGVLYGVIYSMSSANSVPQLVNSTANTAFLGSALAMAGYGGVVADTLLVASGSENAILALSPTGTLSTFVNLGAINGADLLAAPAGLLPGTTGPVMLLSDEFNGNIYEIDRSGNVRLFATVPLTAGQTGLRDMAFGVGGFGPYQDDIFVSVSGSVAGGGTFGSVDVLDRYGNLVAVLTQGTVDAPFDPRGLYFDGSGQLLIADADPSIISATAASFTPVPEPGAFGVMVVGLGLVVFWRRGKQK